MYALTAFLLACVYVMMSSFLLVCVDVMMSSTYDESCSGGAGYGVPV